MGCNKMDNKVSSKMAQASRFGAVGTGLYGARGQRKYLSGAERGAALAAAEALDAEKALFVLTLALTGARVSEVLALTAAAFDLDRHIVALTTLKRRRFVMRELPLPPALMRGLDRCFGLGAAQRDPGRRDARLWGWHRVTAWRLVKAVMAEAGIDGRNACPRGFRHGFGVAALQAGVPLTLAQRWLGHARLTTTAIYTDVSGPEERGFAVRLWDGAAGMAASGLAPAHPPAPSRRREGEVRPAA